MTVAMVDPAALADPAVLARCCGSRRWQALMAQDPARDTDAAAAAARAFDALERDDWLEAFAAHAAIGAPRDGDATGTREQAGMAGADAALRAAFAAANRAYVDRFGFVFLIRARGRSAEEMLEALRSRLGNPPEIEFANACAQQREITALRMAELP